MTKKTINNSEELIKKYSRIYKRHSKIDLKLLDEVKTFVDKGNAILKENEQKLGITRRKIVNELNISEREAERRIKYLKEEGYIEVYKNKQKVFFFSTEKFDRTFGERVFGRVNISQFLKNKFTSILNFLKEHSIEEKYKEDLRKVEESIKKDEYNLEAYNKLIQFECWNKGFKNEFEKLSFRSTANRYV